MWHWFKVGASATVGALAIFGIFRGIQIAISIPAVIQERRRFERTQKALSDAERELLKVNQELSNRKSN
jgi:hypothetical protein